MGRPLLELEFPQSQDDPVPFHPLDQCFIRGEKREAEALGQRDVHGVVHGGAVRPCDGGRLAEQIPVHRLDLKLEIIEHRGCCRRVCLGRPRAKPERVHYFDQAELREYQSTVATPVTVAQGQGLFTVGLFLASKPLRSHRRVQDVAGVDGRDHRRLRTLGRRTTRRDRP